MPMLLLALFIAQSGGWKLDYELDQYTDDPKTEIVQSHYVGKDTSADKFVSTFKRAGGKTLTVSFFRVGEVYQYIRAVEGNDPVEEDSKEVYEKKLKQMLDSSPDDKEKVAPEQHKVIAGIRCTLFHRESKVADLDTVSWADYWYPDDPKLRARLPWLERKSGIRKDGKSEVIDNRTTTKVKLGLV